MNKLFDLRFVIGIFFLVIGVLVLGYGLLTPQPTAVNKWCGAIFIFFGMLMLLFALRKQKE